MREAAVSDLRRRKMEVSRRLAVSQRKVNGVWKLLLALVVCVVALAMVAGPARAETFTVNSTADPGDGTCDASECTLREAVNAANGNGEADTITFDLPNNSTITLGGNQLEISSEMVIEGPGEDQLTVSGNDASRVFYIDGANATIEGLTITQGFFVQPGGGGIFNDAGTLTINDSSVSNNSSESPGGGIANEAGTMTINGSTVSDNFTQAVGAGIANYSGSTLTINNSTVSDNETTGGTSGGIINDRGTLTVSDSTVSGNSAAGGGGIFSQTRVPTDRNPNPAERTTITNSTISGNTGNAFNIPDSNFGGGVYNERGLTIIEYTTITDNTADDGSGSGVANNAILPGVVRTEVGSSIIAGNTNSDVDDVGTANAFESEGYNVIGTGNATDAFDGTNDITGVVNPLLGRLADNGGPTRTHALRSGSPALNRVAERECPPPNTDQRGVRRPQGPRCDSGSFERETVVPGKANLSLSKKASKARPTVGASLTYTLKVKNNGPNRATNVKLVDTLPKGVKATSSSAGCKKQSQRKVVCNIDTLADGRSVAKKITVKVNKKGKLVNRARASSNVADPNAKNNRASAVVRAKPRVVTKQIRCKVKNPDVKLESGKQVVVADSKTGKSTACVAQNDQLVLVRKLGRKSVALIKQGGKQIRVAKGKVVKPGSRKAGARTVVVRVPRRF